MHTVMVFNQYLASTPGFVPLDWRIVKAMIWTETAGPTDSSWKERPMQIGNPGDQGLGALLSKREGGDLIVPPFFKQTLTAASITTIPLMNIRAGVAYLLMRFAIFGYKTINQGPVSDYEVHAKESFSRIAREHHSTVETLRQLNPGLHTLHPHDLIKFQEATTVKVIAGWHPINTVMIAHRYNVGDIRYAQKLEYCLSVMNKVKRTETCET